ncbi:TonB-dependent receptor [Kordiimonas sediminis]|uniref:TonB-dependent receptor n=1 Tax=Kordiimonas sediminis TaxID=1735581 RepID=A0A919AYT0_9PROT|nr:TonB-dependent receptor [Kordiimonas sediminis]GHF29731.1 TonB-dependent receptor [Kordiimonas sediminis]
MYHTTRSFTAICALLAAAPLTVAQTVSAADADAYIEFSSDIERIQVVGERSDRSSIPGSATRLNEEDLQEFKYQDITRILRRVPGVNLQQEDGYGLRPNIGLRGTGVERSSKITLMEDGILIAPAPYAAPSAYYFPTAARMQAVEVRKGSAAVKFGPRSVGGAVNLVSRSIPDETSGFVDTQIGSDSLFTVHGAAGTSTENFGGVVEVFKSENDGFKTLPGGEDTGFDIEDYMGKFRINTDEDADIYQSLEIKLGKTLNDSHETYLGLTDDDFATNPYQRYAASALDFMDTKHEQISLTHHLKIDEIEVITSAYENTFERDWFKLDDLIIDGNRLSTASVLADPDTYSYALSVLKGEVDSGDDVIRLKHNARAYKSRGVQSLVAVPFTAGDVSHDLEFSVRYHEDSESRLQYRESFAMVSGGLNFVGAEQPGEAGNRKVYAKAWAFMVEDTIKVGNWTIVPGVRYESIDLDRSDWASDDPSRLADPSRKETTEVNTLIPGLGVSYKMDDTLTLTGGIYKGFNPPGPGSADAKEEKSLNVEAGVIYDAQGFYAEAMAFYSDYSNILGTCTNATGCIGGDIGDQFNGGAATIQGLELVAGYTADVAHGWAMPLSLSYTFTDAEFDTSFENSFWGDVHEGDHMPYLPRHQLTLNAGLTNDAISFNTSVNYVSKSRTDAGQGAIPLNEKIEGRFLVDAAVTYRMTDAISLFAAVDNLFDKEYAVSRRPYGLRPGKPRTFQTGVRFEF